MNFNISSLKSKFEIDDDISSLILPIAIVIILSTYLYNSIWKKKFRGIPFATPTWPIIGNGIEYSIVFQFCRLNYMIVFVNTNILSPLLGC
jgi:hypothetical protein